jgi:hypothetical protein
MLVKTEEMVTVEGLGHDELVRDVLGVVDAVVVTV